MNHYSNNFSINNNAYYNPVNNAHNNYNQNTARRPFYGQANGQSNPFNSRPFSFQSSLQQILANLMAYLQNGSTQQPQQPTRPTTSYNNNYQGTRFNDTLSGSNRSDAIYGYGGNDTLVGGNGNDQLFGGTGNDRLYASEGDKLFGEQGNDTFYANKSGQAELSGGTGYDTALFSAPMQNYQVTQQAQSNQFQVTHIATNASTLVNNDIEQVNFADQSFTAQGLAEHLNQPTQPQTLELNPEQSSKIQDLMGFGGASVGVTVYDSDNSRTLSVGDVAVLNGGITNGELGRKVLSQADINLIEGNAGVDQQAAQVELNANRAKWQNAGISDYNYTQKLNVFSTPDYTSPVNVSVRNNQVTQAQYADGRNVVDGYNARTIDGLFDEIQNAIDIGAARINVTYDATTGIPSSLYIDRSEMIADEELGITATNFQAV